MFINHNIKHLIKTKCRNRSEFAEIFGVTPTSVSNYENDKVLPRIDLIIKIAEKYNYTLDQIVLKDISIDKDQKVNEPAAQYNSTEKGKEQEKRIKDLNRTKEIQEKTILSQQQTIASQQETISSLLNRNHKTG